MLFICYICTEQIIYMGIELSNHLKLKTTHYYPVVAVGVIPHEAESLPSNVTPSCNPCVKSPVYISQTDKNAMIPDDGKLRGI